LRSSIERSGAKKNGKGSGELVHVTLKAGLEVGGLVLMDDVAPHQSVDHGGHLGKTLLSLFLVLRVPKPLDKGPCGLVIIVVPLPFALVGTDPTKGGTMVRHSLQLLLRGHKISEILGSWQISSLPIPQKRENPGAGLCSGVLIDLRRPAVGKAF
jgi:hypothetical protein